MRLVVSEIFEPDVCQLRSPCVVIDPLTGKSCKATAIWDTGASRSCISPAIAKYLCLPVVGSSPNRTENGVMMSNIHVVDIAIGNVIFPKNSVSTPLLPDDMVLIGMDLIGQGKFTVQNMDVDGKQKKVLTLELP